MSRTTSPLMIRCLKVCRFKLPLPRLRRATFPPGGGGRLSGGWRPPLHDIFGLCAGARNARPLVSHRPPLFCQGRRDTLVGYARQFNTPAAAAQTGEAGVVPHPRRTPVPCPRPASLASGGRGKADCGPQAERTWSRGPAGERHPAALAAGGKVSRPAGRNPRGETQFRRKLFCLLFLEKVGLSFLQ